MTSGYHQANRPQNCGFSGSITRWPFYEDEYQNTLLDKFKFSAFSKPWNSQLSIHLYAPIGKVEAEKFDYPWLFWPELAPMKSTFSFNIFHIIILKTPETDVLKLGQLVNVIVRMNPNLGEDVNNQVVFYLPNPDNYSNVQLLTESFKQKPTELIRFNIFFYIDDWVADVCTYIEILKQKHFYINENLQKKYEASLFGMWQISLDNYTMHPDEFGIIPRDLLASYLKHCSKFRSTQIPFYFHSVTPRASFKLTHETHFGDLTLIDPKSDLRFVSCGNTVYSSLLYHELFTVFDRYIWISILITCSVVILIAKFVNSSRDVILFLIKVGLEQGSPLSNNMLKRTFPVIIGTVIMLFGTILSNGYKNTNMYNLILPKARIPRRTFSELHQENFRIYSRMHVNPVSFKMMSDVVYDEQLKRYYGGNSTPMERSEMYYNRSISEIRYYSRYPESRIYILTILEKAVYSPNLKEIYFIALEKAFKEHKYEYLDYHQTKDLFDLLEKCNNAAILLPHSEAVQYSRMREHNLDEVEVDIGVEALFQKFFCIKKQGIWPKYVIDRQTLINGESGIMCKWERLLNVSYASKTTFGRRSKEPKRAKLNGNIQVIFYLYGIGICISFTHFFLILKPRWLEQFKQLMLRCWKKINFTVISLCKGLHSCSILTYSALLTFEDLGFFKTRVQQIHSDNPSKREI